MLMATLLLASAPALAAEYWLRAETLNMTMPDSNVVAMWGFAKCDASYSICELPTVPGPALDVPAGDTSGLTVNLLNTLPEPVSIVINGQAMPTALSPTSAPVWTDGSSGPRTSRTQRVRSFTHEAAARVGTGVSAVDGSATYTWPAIKPGTYLYQSGTHPQVQVQMGLYGAMTSDGAVNQPYAGSVAYDTAVTMLFSEIDPALHLAVAGDGVNPPTYGTAAGPTSTLNYNPEYFLVNGKGFLSGDGPLATLTAGDKVLLRLINAGLTTRVPMISNGHISVIAEDGNLLPWGNNPRQQYSVLLPAAKTIDALYVAQVVDGQDSRISIFDRRLGLINSAMLDGGMMAYLDVTLPPLVTPPAITAPAAGVVYYATQNTPYTYQVLTGNAPLVAALSSRSSKRRHDERKDRHDHDDGDRGDKHKEDKHGKHHDDDHDGNNGGSQTGPQIPDTRFSLDVRPFGMSIDESGLISWLPRKEHVGNHHVTVRVTKRNGLYDTKPFFVEVAAKPNIPPVGVNDIYHITAGGTLNVAAPGFLANDTDADLDTLTAPTEMVVGTQLGTVSTESDGAFTYTPKSSDPVVDNFTYRASDGVDMSAPTTVTINVIANRRPVASNDSAKAPVRNARKVYTPVSIDVLANDFDRDAKLDAGNHIAIATVNVVAQPNKGGMVEVNEATGVISYTPRAKFKGVETFTYNVQDTYGATSNTVTVRVSVRK